MLQSYRNHQSPYPHSQAHQLVCSSPASSSSLSLSLLIAVYIPIITVVPLYCYYAAVSKGEEKPFPHPTITMTACHYSQDIVFRYPSLHLFRYFMLIAASILALAFFVVFKWINAVGILINYPHKLPTLLFYLAELSIPLYCVCIGTIDQKDTGPLHTPCAVFFFIILVIVIEWITIHLTLMRGYDTRSLSKTSLRIKQLLAGYVGLVWIYCLYGTYLINEEQHGQSFESDGPSKQLGDPFVVIVEWNTVIFCLLWILSFAYQWKYFNLVIVSKKLELGQTESC